MQDGKQTVFSAYTSMSEGGFWRFLLHIGQGHHKGRNYMFSTYIHPYLQIFINDHIHQLQFYEISDRNSTRTLIQNYGLSIYETSYKLNEIIALLERENLKYDDKNLQNLNKICQVGFCFVRQNKTSHVCFQETLDFIKQTLKISDQDLISQECLRSPNIDKYIKLLLSAISKYMETNYKISENAKLEYIGEQDLINITETNSLVINHKIYKIQIESNTNKEYKYWLYCSNYTYYSRYDEALSTFNRDNHQEGYWTLIYLVPISSKITKYGFSEDVVDVGVYIHKIMEYPTQIYVPDQSDLDNIYRMSQKDEKTKRNVYWFLGDLIEDMWPLPQIKKMVNTKKGGSLREAIQSEMNRLNESSMRIMNNMY